MFTNKKNFELKFDIPSLSLSIFPPTPQLLEYLSIDVSVEDGPSFTRNFKSIMLLYLIVHNFSNETQTHGLLRRKIKV